MCTDRLSWSAICLFECPLATFTKISFSLDVSSPMLLSCDSSLLDVSTIVIFRSFFTISGAVSNMEMCSSKFAAIVLLMGMVDNDTNGAVVNSESLFLRVCRILNPNIEGSAMIMSAGIKSKTELEILCDGEDEEKVLEELKIAFENQLGE